MKKGYKLAALAMSAVMTLGVAAGCGSSGQSGTTAGSGGAPKSDAAAPAPTQTPAASESKKEPIELRIAWWGSQDRHNRTLKAIELYQQQNPHVKISAEFTAWDGYWDKLATMAAGKNLPDIIQMDYKYLNEYVTKKLIVELDPFIQSKSLDLSDTADTATSGGKVNGKMYAINLGSNSVALAYDPAMFQKAGVPEPKPGYTWDDFDKMLRELKSKLGNDYYGFPIEDGNNMFKHLLREKGLWLFNDAGDALGYPDDQPLIEYFTFFNKLQKDGVAPPPEVTAEVKGRLEDSLLPRGKVPMQFMHSNQIVAVTKAANRPLKLMILPKIAGGKEGHFLKPSQFFSVTSHSKQAEEAAKFISFFTNDLKANEVLGGERGVPIATKVRKHLYDNLDPASKEMFDYIELVQQHAREIDPPDPAGGGKVEDAFKRIQESINYGKLTPEQGAKQFREEATKALK